MDLLKAEINRKKIATDKIINTLNPSTKIGNTRFVRKGDVKRFEEKEKVNADKLILDTSVTVIDKNPYIPNFEKKIDKMQILQKSLQDLSGLSIEQIKYRLRMIRQPVTLFGESDKERLLRLSKLQVDEQQGMIFD